MTTTLDNPPVLLEDSPPSSVNTSRLPTLPALSPVPTYVGIAVAAIGFVLIAYAWGRVAGETSVGLQLPYLVSGGLGGLASVLVGLTVISVAARRRDTQLREQQMVLLAAALSELRTALDPEGS